jgi:uncharacterized protein (DUF427 family)
VSDFPQMIAPVNHTEPVPRRIRAVLAGETVLDTTAAIYVWEWPNYPQYYVPKVGEVTWTEGAAGLRRRRAPRPGQPGAL